MPGLSPRGIAQRVQPRILPTDKVLLLLLNYRCYRDEFRSQPSCAEKVPLKNPSLFSRISIMDYLWSPLFQ